MTKLSYTDTDTGTPIIFIHGLGARKESWKHQLPLSTNYRLIMVDLRGHGETVENENLSVKNFATDVIELIDSLNIKAAYICGLSLGGFVAQEIHVQRSDLVAGLILASTTAYIPKFYEHGAIAEARRDYENGSLLDDIVARGIVDKSFTEDAKDAFLIRDSYLEAARAVFGLNYFYDLPSIKVPVLLIGGRQDKVIPIVNISLMAKWLKNHKSMILENAGHLCNIEKASEFNSTVSGFLFGLYCQNRI
ncbi:MAG: alpha/beta fold hydrolase [Bacilli bacterium]|nr:alpha/beta fold hydrolase [Bacilli bacterium]